MRKSFVLFVMLFVFAIGGLSYVSADLLKEKDNVQIRENAIYGDKSAVEGVIIERNIKYDNYMRWNTTYTAGENPLCNTVYAFDWSRGLHEVGIPRANGMELHTEPVWGIDSAIGTAEDLKGLSKAIQELFQETEPGQENRAVIDLSDYLEYYEYEVMIDLPGDILYYHINKNEIEREDLVHYSGNESYIKELEEQLHIIEVLTEFFKIPVIENHLYEISVEKDMQGNLHGWGYGSANGGGSSGNVTIGGAPENADAFSLWAISAYTDDKCFFTFDPHTNSGKLVDTSQIQGGYGIYCLPFDTEKKIIDVDNLKLVYSLDPNEAVYNLYFDEYRRNLLLLHEKEEGSTLTVIDADTMEKKQEIVYRKDGYGASVYLYEDFILLHFAENLMVLSQTEDNQYREEITCNITYLLDELGVQYIDDSYMDFDWDGERLIMGGSISSKGGYYYQECGFYLAVYDKTGLVYYGEYESSLDAESSYDTIYNDSFYNYHYPCRPTENEPIKIILP